MRTEKRIKIFCYAQHCSSRNGGIVPVREIEDWEGENPERAEEGEFSDDWNLIAEGTLDEIATSLKQEIRMLKRIPFNSNVAFSLRQVRNSLKIIS